MNLVGRYVNLKLNVSLPEGEPEVGACKIVSKAQLRFLHKNDQFSMHACKVTSTYRGQYYSNKQVR